MKRFIAVFLVFACSAALLMAAGEQEAAKPAFPERPVEAVVAWAAGGGADLVFRAMAAVFPKYANGQPLVIKNVPGAAGVPGIAEFKQARPDGYTVLHWNVAHVIKTHMSEVPFTATEFTPVIKLVEANNYLNVRADAPWKTLGEFLDEARANPGQLSVGNAGPGGGNHMAALLLEQATGVKFLHVPFQGGGPSVTGLLAGDVMSAMNIAPEGISNVQAGQLRILAVFGTKRFDTFPDVPTAAEQGVALDLPQWRGVVAPPNTPEPIVRQLHDIFKKCIEDPEFVAKMKELNTTPSYGSAQEFGALVAADDARYEKLIKAEKMGDRYK